MSSGFDRKNIVVNETLRAMDNITLLDFQTDSN